MKTNSIFLIVFLACRLLYAQTTGIAVQGIARDANKSAIAGKKLLFTFTVSGTASSGPAISPYKETQEITTDAFGVFSHIIGTGNASTSVEFSDMPFGRAHLVLKVEVGSVVVLEGPFQYSPYAKNADNGVPVGGIIMWTGSVVPDGWALCDGQTVEGFATPDLRGRFIVGAGQNASPAGGDSNPTYALKDIGGKNGVSLTVAEMPDHNHGGSSTTSNNGTHRHDLWSILGNGSLATLSGAYTGFGAFTGLYLDGGWQSRGNGYIDNAGDHNHTVSIAAQGDNTAHENRPPYYALAYIVRVR